MQRASNIYIYIYIYNNNGVGGLEVACWPLVLKPGRSRRIFKGEKILSRLSHVADLRHVKDFYNYVEVEL
jgi:hypothetical protein